MKFTELKANIQLAAKLNMDYSYFTYLIYKRSDDQNYIPYIIPKKSGDYRKIAAPCKTLKYIQRQIANFIYDEIDVKNCVHGFARGKDIKTNANYHLKRKHILNLDLKDFFDSITVNRVYGVFHGHPFNFPEKLSSCLAKIATYHGSLTQGSPLSPIISTLVCRRLDNDLKSFAVKYGLRYSRYADDITFSSIRTMKELFKENPVTSKIILCEELVDIITRNDFQINEDKVRYRNKTQRMEVTGLIINDKPNLVRNYRDQIRAMLHAWKKFGYENAEKEYLSKFSRGHKSFKQVIYGKLNFYKSVRGVTDHYYQQMAKLFNILSPDMKLLLKPTPEEIIQKAVWVIENTVNVEKNDSPIERMSQGTCFFLKNIGIVTAAHVLFPNKKNAANEFDVDFNQSPMTNFYILNPTNPSHRINVQLVNLDRNRDWAVLSLKDANDLSINKDYFELESCCKIQTGTEIMLCGYPSFELGHQIRKETGQIVAKKTEHAVKKFEITADIRHGNSGGPILNNKIQVLGWADAADPSIVNEIGELLDNYKSTSV